MSGILLLIPTILIGYIFTKKHFFLNYRYSKLSGQHLYFSAASIGFSFVALSCIVYFLLYNFCLGIFCLVLKKCIIIDYNIFSSAKSLFQKDNTPINIFFIYIISIVIAYLFYLNDKKSIKDNDIYNPLFFQIISEDPTDVLLNLSAMADNSNEEKKYNDRTIMLTMKDRKVYVGVVSETRKKMFSRFSTGSTDFEFMPVMSGYRDKDTLDLVLTTIYSEAIENNLNITIILKKEDILSLTKVNHSQFSNFLKNKNKLHKDILSSYKSGKEIIIKYEDDYYLGIVTKLQDLDQITLQKHPYFYFYVLKSSKKNISEIKILFSTEKIKELIFSNDMIKTFDQLVEDKDKKSKKDDKS